MKLLNLLESHQPGPAQTTFISWKGLASAFELDQVWDFADPDEAPPRDILNSAFEEVESYVKNYGTISDGERVQLENSIAKDIVKHWSAENILPQKIKIKDLVRNANTWSQREPRNKNIFGKVPAADVGLEFIENEAGVSFTIYPAFEIPYVETYYELFSLLPEFNLEELTGWEVAETLLSIQECLGEGIYIDLANWESTRLKDF